MRGMLRLKRMELAARVDEEQARLLRVEQRLRQLNRNTAVASLKWRQICPGADRPDGADRGRQRGTDSSRPAKLAKHAPGLSGTGAAQTGQPWFALMANIPYVETTWRLRWAWASTCAADKKPGLERYTCQLEGTRCRAKHGHVIHTAEAIALPQTYAFL